MAEAAEGLGALAPRGESSVGLHLANLVNDKVIVTSKNNGDEQYIRRQFHCTLCWKQEVTVTGHTRRLTVP